MTTGRSATMPLDGSTAAPGRVAADTVPDMAPDMAPDLSPDVSPGGARRSSATSTTSTPWHSPEGDERRLIATGSDHG